MLPHLSSFHAAVVVAVLLGSSYVGWLCVRASFWMWVVDMLPDEREEAAMKIERPWLWRALTLWARVDRYIFKYD